MKELFQIEFYDGQWDGSPHNESGTASDVKRSLTEFLTHYTKGDIRKDAWFKVKRIQ